MMKIKETEKGESGTDVEISSIEEGDVDFEGYSGGGRAQSLHRCMTQSIDKEHGGSVAQGIIIVLNQAENRRSQKIEKGE